MRAGRCPHGVGALPGMRVCKVCVRAAQRMVGALPQKKNEWNKWKNHFYEMKGGCKDQCHFMKKKGTRRCLHQYTKSLITPSLHDHNV